jgi:hypothetical protein
MIQRRLVRVCRRDQRQHAGIRPLGEGKHVTDGRGSTRMIFVVISGQKLDEDDPVAFLTPVGWNWCQTAWRDDGCAVRRWNRSSPMVAV